MASLWYPATIRGTIKTTIWHLETFAPPTGPPMQPPVSGVEIVRTLKPPVDFYRFLYHGVGDPWLWTNRRRLPDDELERLIHRPSVDLRVLWQHGAPAGYAEFDFRDPDDTELLYFGLFPAFVGQGLGRYFIDWCVRHAFQTGARRFWVHTCDLDHPRARAAYEAAGFVHFDTEIGEERVLDGMTIPEHVQERDIREA